MTNLQEKQKRINKKKNNQALLHESTIACLWSTGLFTKHKCFFNEARALLYTSSRSASDFLQSTNDSSRATASRNKRFTKQALNDNTQTTKQRQTETQRTTQDARTKKLKTEIMMCHYWSITTLKERLISSRPGTRKRTHPEASCRKVTC